MDLAKIGKYIAGKRKELGLTQKQVAEKLGMSDKSVSKWERGIYLPDVSVYQELCDILGISINEFLAGEDIREEDLVGKADENLLQVTVSGKQRQTFLKRIVAGLVVAVLFLSCVAGTFIYRNWKTRNSIAPLDQDSVEVKTADLLAGIDGTFLYRYRTDGSFNSMTLYISEYHSGKLVSKEEAAYLGWSGNKSPSDGIIAIVPDYDEYKVKVVLADGASKLSADVPILEGVQGREYFLRSSAQTEDAVKIKSGREQGLLALMYGKDELNSGSIDDFQGKYSAAKNEYEYYFTLEFEKGDQKKQ